MASTGRSETNAAVGSGNGGALDDREPDSDYVYTKKELIKILASRRGCLGANLQQRKVVLAEIIAQTYQRNIQTKPLKMRLVARLWN